MNQQIEIEVIDKDGWKKTFPIRKNIFHIGSVTANDVVLEAKRGAGIAPRHAQFIALQEGGYRLVNLGDTEIHLEGTENRIVPPHSEQGKVTSSTQGRCRSSSDWSSPLNSLSSSTLPMQCM